MCAAKDEFNIEILEDGQIKFDTGAFSGKNHASAEEFLKMIEEMAGGEVQRTPKKEGKHHHHHHKHAHHKH